MNKIDLQQELQCIIHFKQEHATLMKASMLIWHEANSEAYWVVMIRELVEVAGYTYSRIAKRMNVCASTVQKLATQNGRKPRQAVFFQLVCLYYRVFYGPYRNPQIVQYTKTHPWSVLDRIPKEWLTNFNDYI